MSKKASAATVEKEAEKDNPMPTEYDANVIQRVPAEVPYEGGRVDVDLIFNPNAQDKTFDQHLDEYAMRARVRPDLLPDDESNARAMQAQTLIDAAGWLFDTVIEGIEGIGVDGEERPVEWRSLLFTPAQKKVVVEQGILYGIPLQAEQAKARPSWAAHFGRSTTRLLCRFDGSELITSHSMKPADNKTLAEFHKLLAEGAPHLQLAPLYEQLEGRGTGYRDGIIPKHHKAQAVYGHCLTQDNVLGKKYRS